MDSAARSSAVVVALLAATALPLQATVHPPRATPAAGEIDDRVTLPGNVHHLARAQNDAGAASPELPMQRIILLLRRRPGAETELRGLLGAQQDPASPSYHRWLTPEEFGRRFGLADDQVGAVASWLRAEGFTVDEVARGRGWIQASGTARQVERAFRTPIHEYVVAGSRHHANAAEPSVPRTLAPLVAGIVSLHDFRHSPLSRSRKVMPADQISGQNYLAPGDFATIYYVNPLYTAGFKGAGVTIAIPGRSDIVLADVQTFRSYFGLPANDPVIIHNGPAPGDLGGNEEVEADLDVQWSGAVAPQATVDFVISASTFSTDGIDLSSAYVVDNDVAPILSLSFGSCELTQSASSLAFYSDLWAQAAAQGITVFVASGDSGVTACFGLASVSGLCSTPYDVCVGGTLFSDSPASTWWSSSPDPVTKASALSYIPEVVWNEPGVGETGGGASAIYPKPSWQSAPGVPSDGSRDVPDASLAASLHDGYLVFAGNLLHAVGGTSAAAPCFAGLMALIVQKTGNAQGNANFTLYKLGSQQYGASGPAVFHDVTAGNNGVTGVAGFAAGPGYDQATGLGSIDANALAAAWIPSAASPDFGLMLSAADFTLKPGQGAAITVSFYSFGGFASPVTFSLSGLTPGITAVFAPPSLLGSGSSTLTLTTAPSAATGWKELTLQGTGGGLTHSLKIYLLLVADSAPPVFNFLVAPPNGIALDLATGPDGAVWATIGGSGGAGDQIGRVTTAGALTEFPLASCAAGHQCTPFGITSGPDGALWFVESNSRNIGRIATSGSVTEFPLPAADQSNLVTGIASGADGALWFNEIGAAPKEGRLSTGGAFSAFPLPASDAWTTPASLTTGITAGPDGALWFTTYNGNTIGRLTTAGALTEFPVPTPQSGLASIVAGPDGALWFAESWARKIGRITTAGAITELPTGVPYFPNYGDILDLIVGPDGNLWFIADLTKGAVFRGVLARMTPAGNITWFNFVKAYDLLTGPDGNLWFIDLSGRIGSLPFPKRATFFYTVPPCRLLDTRLPAGPLGGPALATGQVRDVPAGGNCGIPSDAAAVAANLTIVNPSVDGFVANSDTASSLTTSTLNFRAGQVRANNAILKLSPTGHFFVLLSGAPGQGHFLVDVTGYFQ